MCSEKICNNTLAYLVSPNKLAYLRSFLLIGNISFSPLSKIISNHHTGQCYGILYCNDRESLWAGLLCSIFKHKTIPRSFVVRTIINKWYLMCHNYFEFTHNIFILLVFNMIYNLAIWYNLLILIIIHWT